MKIRILCSIIFFFRKIVLLHEIMVEKYCTAGQATEDNTGSVNTRVRHKSVNTPLSHERLFVRTWLAVYALPPTTIYCEPGAYEKPFVG